VGEAFWNYHVEDELREECKIDTMAFKNDSDREKVMREIESLRRISTNKHHYCDEKCKKRGKCVTYLISLCTCFAQDVASCGLQMVFGS